MTRLARLPLNHCVISGGDEGDLDGLCGEVCAV